MENRENKAAKAYKDSSNIKEAIKNAWNFGTDQSLSDKEKVQQLGELLKDTFSATEDYKKKRIERKAEVAERLQQVRKESGLMQKEVADRTGINMVTLSGYEIGKNEPNMEALVRLADVYNVSLDYLLCRTDTKG